MSKVRLPQLPVRAAEAHKGDFGRVFVIAGSRGMVGAGCLAAKAALRSGAGLVTLAVPASVWDVAATKLTCVMTAGFADTPGGAFAESAFEPLMERSGRADVVALGPGLGREVETGRLVRKLAEKLEPPLVIDADGLFHLSGRLDRLKGRKSSTVVTPHPGEMANLIGSDTAEVQADRVGTAKNVAREYHVVCVLKGAGTVVSDGRRTYVNTTGNPGMATGGTGDVLTGVIAGLIGQGLSAFDASVLGVYLHGLAGDLAAEHFGVHGLIASDVLDSLPAAFLAYQRK
jgi:NAD(P)H-hydrate epimerase